ncbi:MAG: SDR family oxidoreductase [Frankiaceae bacterium]|nr:SDR family oxidoreductase [Frankiaceae bacterium]MBV9871373.1 SDR family oxidoreductase [Frankiaceae bacterium]
MTQTTRTVNSAGVNLTVHERGDAAAPTIILVHGYPDTSAVWNEVASRLEARFHVVTYDVRGAGESDAPKRTADYDLSLLAADLQAVADAVSPGRRVHLVAHDWGSIQTWESVTTAGAEQRFASYTTVSGPSLDHVGFWMRDKSQRSTRQLVRQGRKSWYIAAFHTPVAPVLWRTVLSKTFAPAIARMEGLPDAADYPSPTLGADGARGVKLYRANVRSSLRNPRERPTDVPVQLIIATKDRYVSPAIALSSKLWVSKLWVREVQTGHWLPRKAPDVMAQAVAEFVDYTEGGQEPRSLRRLRSGASSRAGAREFDDKLVVVTGAGSGIGRETALAFAALGATVVIADLNAAPAEATADLVRAQGVDAHAYVVDVSDVAAMEDFVKRVVADHGVPDVVVNNAGIGIAGSFLDTTAADWERIVDVNLLGVVTGCRLFGQAMVDRREGGQIVNVASAAAFTPSRALGAYCATKAAVLMLSECLRAELADKGIGVSAICPGIVNTPITTSTHYVGISDAEESDRRKRVSKQYALRNFPPSKVATAIVKAVRTNAAVVPVTPEARGARFMSRLSPGAMRRFAQIDAL